MQGLTRADCEALDRADPLGPLYAEFLLPAGCIYLDGNSLGPLTRGARRRVLEAMDLEWAQDLIRSWNTHDWIGLPERLGARIAPLIGAPAADVVVVDSTSVNLFKLAAAYARTTAPRCRIVTELGNFPTDLYVLQGLAELMGPAVEVRAVPRADLSAAIDRETSLVVLTHVHYRSAEMFDLAAVTALAQAHGAAILWDLSHSAGAVPVELEATRADLAVGCTYKYLNGGPGSPAFLYVRRDLQQRLGAGIAGWLGHAQPFEFTDDYQPAPGITRQRAGTPGILGMAALDGSLEVFAHTCIAAIRAKSMQLTQSFIELVERRCAGFGLALATPRDPARRGSHVSFAHPEAYAIMQALIARGVIGDFRAPDLIRFGFTPLYTRHVDVWDAVTALTEVLAKAEWRHAGHRHKRAVT